MYIERERNSERCRRKEEKSKVQQTLKQSNITNELPRVGFEPTTPHSRQNEHDLATAAAQLGGAKSYVS